MPSEVRVVDASGGTARSRHRLMLLVCAATAAAFLLWIELFPDGALLAGLFLVSVASHVLVHVFPAYEPVLLFVAKHHAPWAIAISGTAGCMLAGVLDYWLLGRLFNLRRIRYRFDNSRFFRWANETFDRMPFWLLVMGGFSPLPFTPLKFLSIASSYPLRRYQAAVVVGRFPRFYLLAWLGARFELSNGLLVGVATIMVAIAAARAVFQRVRTSASAAELASEAEPDDG